MLIVRSKYWMLVGSYFCYATALEELTFLEIDFFRKILVLALAGAQRGVNAVQRAVIQA